MISPVNSGNNVVVWGALANKSAFVILAPLTNTEETTEEFFYDSPIFPSTFPVKATEKYPGKLLQACLLYQELARIFKIKTQTCTHYSFSSALRSFMPDESAEVLAVEESTSQAQFEHALLDVFEISSRYTCFFLLDPDAVAFGVEVGLSPYLPRSIDQSEQISLCKCRPCGRRRHDSLSFN